MYALKLLGLGLLVAGVVPADGLILSVPPRILDSTDMSGAMVPSGSCSSHQSFHGADRSLWRCNAATGTWYQFLGPNPPLGPATAAVMGGVKVGANLTVASDGTLSVAAPYTDAQALTAAKAGLGSAAQQPTGAFYPATGNPSGFLTSAPVTSVAGRAGAVTLAASDVSGLGVAAKLSSGTTTTSAGGTFTATLTPACTAAPAIIEVTAKAAGTLLSNAANASWTTATASTVSGIVTSPATLTLLGLTVVAPPTGTPVEVLAICP